ncbi:MAG: flagellar brake protein [Pseudomonadota bacterium]|nr:flagellar brake protein [Pseudomonadota bacterium]
METQPAPLDAMSAANSGLDEFRVSSVREITVLLKQLCDGSVLLNINASDGSVYKSAIWTLDSAKEVISFNADIRDPALRALLDCDEATVVGYLDSVKLQFDIDDLVLVQGQRASVLSCPFPHEMYRFQRRDAFRVRPVSRSSPVAQCRHPTHEQKISLRVLDVSIGGFGLFLPEGTPLLQPGVLLRGVQVDLDIDTVLHVDLRLKHITTLNADAHGSRLGCELVRPNNDTVRSLQRFIDQTQKRGRLMALS